MESQKTLGLKTPERTSTSSSSFLASPKEIETWIQSLPTANIGETSRQVFKTLVEFNRVDIPNIARIKIAESFRQPIEYIASNLRKYYCDVSFPVSAKSRKIAVLNRELYAELAISYKIFIEKMVSSTGSKFDKKLLVIAIHRALRYLGLVNFQSAIIYDPYPVNIWKEINLLYAFSEQNKIDHIPVKEGHAKSDTSTIASIYKQNLLFAISSPYRQRQREIRRIQKMLPIWAEKTALSKTPTHHKNTDFIVQLTDDKPPVHFELENVALNEFSRIISSKELVSFLRAEFDALPAEQPGLTSLSSDKQTSKHLLRQIIHSLSHVPRREFVRTKLNFELKTAVGLYAIHTLLSRPPPDVAITHEEYDDEMDWPDQKSSASMLYSHGEQRLSVYNGNPVSEEQVISSYAPSSNYRYSQAPQWANSSEHPDIETFSCKTVNESAGGYCIHWHGPNIPRIRVGEIIGIQSTSNANQFGIGISRWMKYIHGFGLQLGMEMISPGSIPVNLVNIEQPDSIYQGLLLPELKSSGKASSLIVSSMVFKVGDHLKMENLNNAHSTIRLTYLLESTGAFSQFQFVYEHSPDNTDEDDGNEFEGVWSML